MNDRKSTEVSRIEEKICPKCKEIYHFLHAGNRENFFELLDDIIIFCKDKGFIDNSTINLIRHHISKIKEQLKIPKLIKERLKGLL